MTNPISAPPASQSSFGSQLQSSDMQSGLYIVSTPIGNLRDITLRALDVLSGVDLILAEDTRQTIKLLNAYKIETPLSAYHDHNAAKRIPGLLKKLEEGASIALVSDAGTPLVSDPGFKLARDAMEAGHNVVPVPGASAVLAGLVTSGLPSDIFTFIGFLPPKTTARKAMLETVKNVPGTLVFFETGPRLVACLEDIGAILGERSGAIARELTKHYEETRRGHISDLIDSIKTSPPRGEIVLLIGADLARGLWDSADVDRGLTDSIAEMGLKRASNHIAELSGWAKRDVYKRALEIKRVLDHEQSR